MLCSQVAGVCEWIAPKRPPPPTAQRITSGTGACSLDMYQYLADWFTRLSIARAMKSPNMISTTGRRPVTALPNAAPASASSEIGRVEHALVAELLREAGGRLEDASGRGDVLAEEHDPLVAAHLGRERVANGGAQVGGHPAYSVAVAAGSG